MSEHPPTSCELFDEHVDEMALGQLDEPLRNALLAHAAACPACHSLLESLSTVADRLLLAAPQIEPPAGFENRTLARLEIPSVGPARSSFAKLVAAAAVVLLVAAGGLVAARLADDATADAAPIVAVNGMQIGSAQLIAEPVAHVVVVIDTPRPSPGFRTCELRSPDGSWEEVGRWDSEDIASGVWAVGIDPSLLDATAMRITADGAVLSTATFD